MWDILCSRRVDHALRAGCLYSAILPPLLKDDPIFEDSTITTRGDVAPIFVNPRKEFVYRLRYPVVMEPRWGYLLADPLTVIDESLPYSEFTRSWRNMPVFYGVPRVQDFSHSHRRLGDVRQEDVIISMRYPWPAEVNYYHIYMDMLSRLALMDQYGIDDAIPIVVSADLAKQRFFKEITTRGALSNRKWIVQDGFYIETREAIFARTNEGHRDRLDFLLDHIDAPQGDPRSNRRIFIVRNASKRGRGILNMDELRPVLREFDFEVLDTEDLSLAEQMDLFSTSGVVAGVHGAGLINIMFRRNAPLTLLEIFSPTETPLHFYALATQYGFRYSHVQGHSPDTSGRAPNFHLDAEVLRHMLTTL